MIIELILFLQVIFLIIMRERIGGVPFETKKSGGNIEIRFYPKGENAKNPDGIVFMLSLSKEDRKKLADIIS